MRYVEIKSVARALGIQDENPTGEEVLNRIQIIQREREQLLRLTKTWEEHPEGYEGPCACAECVACSL